MTLSQSYARALLEVVEARGNTQPAPEILQNLRQALARRGHEKLLPRVFADYEKMQLAEGRIEAYKTVSPEAEQTRMLLELYRKLTTPTA